MKFFTAHLRGRHEPVLIPENFSWGAFVTGPFWLASHSAWLAAILVAAADVLIATLTHGPLELALSLWAAWLTGLFAHDLRRWTLMHRGYTEAHLIAARTETAALGRLLAARPDIIPLLVLKT